MITCNLKGRLGNQLFQIATAHALALDNGDRCIFPLGIEGATPNIYERTFYANTVLRNIVYGYDFSWIKSIYREPGFHYSKIGYQDGLLLDGYFQSEKYFVHQRDRILELFSPSEYITERVERYTEVINFGECVAVHVRRGDYVKLSDVHTNLAENSPYYTDALSKFSNKKKVFFSDDIQWCKQKFGDQHTYVANENDVVELFLFSKMSSKIIANSSFSWWGAWLGSFDDEVIAPKQWFGQNNSHLNTEDVIPQRWKRI